MRACARPDAVKAVAPYYGLIPWASAQPDWSKLDAKVVGEYAADDGSFPPDKVHELEDTLKGLGKDVEMHIHPGTDHAFFNDQRPEVYAPDASAESFARTVDLFRTTL